PDASFGVPDDRTPFAVPRGAGNSLNAESGPREPCLRNGAMDELPVGGAAGSSSVPTRSLLRCDREAVRELLVEPDPILRVDIEPVVRMSAAGTLEEPERPSGHGERAEGVLERVIEPDEAVVIRADARRV